MPKRSADENRIVNLPAPILRFLGAAGTGDTMAVLADVALSPDRLYRVVEEVGGCIAWGGALELAPADDILITVERPMEIDTEAQMVASILAKKKTAGATHVVIDIQSDLRPRSELPNLPSMSERRSRSWASGSVCGWRP